MTDESDPTEGLPDDLKAVLRDQSIIVPQDARVFERIAEWAKAPSGTASADLGEQVSVASGVDVNAAARAMVSGTVEDLVQTLVEDPSTIEYLRELLSLLAAREAELETAMLTLRLIVEAADKDVIAMRDIARAALAAADPAEEKT